MAKAGTTGYEYDAANNPTKQGTGPEAGVTREPYAYSYDDPVNRVDPTGTIGQFCESEAEWREHVEEARKKELEEEEAAKLEREVNRCGGVVDAAYGGQPKWPCGGEEGEGPQTDEPPTPVTPLPPPGGQPGVPGIKVPTPPFFPEPVEPVFP